MKATVSIYHNQTPRENNHMNPITRTPCGTFWGFCGNCTLFFAYDYEVTRHPADTTDEFLALIWRANNRVDGSAVEVLPDTARSLSVGDVVQFGDEAYAVAHVGWEVVDPMDFRSALDAVEEQFEIPTPERDPDPLHLEIDREQNQYEADLRRMAP